MLRCIKPRVSSSFYSLTTRHSAGHHPAFHRTSLADLVSECNMWHDVWQGERRCRPQSLIPPSWSSIRDPISPPHCFGCMLPWCHHKESPDGQSGQNMPTTQSQFITFSSSLFPRPHRAFSLDQVVNTSISSSPPPPHPGHLLAQSQAQAGPLQSWASAKLP